VVHHRDTNVKHADVTRRRGWSFIVVDLGIGSVLGMRLSSVPLGWRGPRQHWRSPTATGPRRAESHMASPDVAARPRAAAASLPCDRRQTLLRVSSGIAIMGLTGPVAALGPIRAFSA
jgi:hypothetical protein